MKGSETVENITTLAICGMTTVGLYALGAGLWSFLAFVMLLNLNYIIKRKKDK